MSERLGAIGEIERRIVAEGGARLDSASLWTETELVANGADADILIIGASEPLTAAVLEQLPRVRCVVRRGVGVDNVDVDAATRLGIGVSYIPDASVEEVSDHALTLLLCAERRACVAHTHTVAGEPGAAGAAVSAARRFGDLTLGVIGFGRIGRALARKADGVFGRIVAYDPLLEAPAATASGDVQLVNLETLLRESNLVSLHAASQPNSPPILDTTAFSQMPPGTVVVNTARGKLIDEPALLDALADGHLAAAALDVTAEEPLSATSPLRGHPKVLLTGHTAAKGMRSSASLREGVVAATLRILAGATPKHLSNPHVLATPKSRLPMVAPDRPSENARR